jgi:hypothetical protein
MVLRLKKDIYWGNTEAILGLAAKKDMKIVTRWAIY